MIDTLPTSVRYAKNGAAGSWWRTAKADGQVHLGWNNVPPELLRKPEFSKIERVIRKYWGVKQGATQDFNALRDLLDKPSQHIWITLKMDVCGGAPFTMAHSLIQTEKAKQREIFG